MQRNTRSNPGTHTSPAPRYMIPTPPRIRPLQSCTTLERDAEALRLPQGRFEETSPDGMRNRPTSGSSQNDSARAIATATSRRCSGES